MAGIVSSCFTVLEPCPAEPSVPVPDSSADETPALEYHYGLVQSNEARNIRSSLINAGVDYKTSETSSVRFETGRKIYDTQDGSSWYDSIKAETVAQVKCVMNF